MVGIDHPTFILEAYQALQTKRHSKPRQNCWSIKTNRNPCDVEGILEWVSTRPKLTTFKIIYVLAARCTVGISNLKDRFVWTRRIVVKPRATITILLSHIVQPPEV